MRISPVRRLQVSLWHHTFFKTPFLMSTPARDYNSISPSAEYLVRLKALTRIPFAREAAAILIDGTAPVPVDQERKDFFKRLLHFENRYWTADDLLRQTRPQHVLEISSGYSFRGLGWCFEQPVHFIDTDLPELVAAKNPLIQPLIAGHAGTMKGKFELLPLNVMDTAGFNAVIDRFEAGPVSIVNEGLLVYLGDEEKRQLCHTIRDILTRRGGYWVTGDVYIKTEAEERGPRHPVWEAFRKQHKIDENRFDSYAAAQALFESCGLEVVERKALATDKLSCLDWPGVNKNEIIQLLEHKQQVRESWCLKAR